MTLNALFSAVFTTPAAPVILAVLAARLALSRTKAPKTLTALLWWVVAFRLLCPAIPIPVSQEVTRTLNASGQAITSILPMERVPETPDAPQPHAPDMAPSEATVNPIPDTPTPLTLTGLFPWLWLSGAVGMLAYSAVSYLSLRRKLVGAVQLERGVWLADHINAPFVLGLVRPAIYLPSHLPESDRPFLLCHERHHIRRLDHILKALLFLGLALRWYDPLVWAAFRLASRDMELSCDEEVLKELGPQIKGDYARSLLALSTGWRPAPAPLAFGEGDAPSRIKHLARWVPQTGKPSRLALLLAALVMVACACQLTPNTPYYDSVADYAAEFLPESGKAFGVPRDIIFQVSSYGIPSELLIRSYPTAYFARFSDTQSATLTQTAIVSGLAPEGDLELWSLNHAFSLDDIPPDQPELENHSGRYRIVALSTQRGYQILCSIRETDGMEFKTYHDSWEEAIHDWYVTEYELDRPLYVVDWSHRYPELQDYGNYPLHLEKGNGWSLYCPVTGWSALQDEAGWVSSYTGARLTIQHLDSFPLDLPPEEHTEYVYYNDPGGGIWQLRLHWKDPNLFANPHYPYITMERALLKDMAESFTLTN